MEKNEPTYLKAPKQSFLIGGHGFINLIFFSSNLPRNASKTTKPGNGNGPDIPKLSKLKND